VGILCKRIGEHGDLFFFFEKKVKMLFEMVITYYWLKKSILHRVFQKYTCLKCLEIALAP
jgi:hypothetical protein